MRKIKKINGFLVVKFNDREKREYEGTALGEYLNRYNAAIKFLTLVAEGTVSIGTETEDPASAAAGGFKVKSNSRLFTREKMRGM